MNSTLEHYAQFIHQYFQSSSLADLAKRTGLHRHAIHSKIRVLSQNGVNLPKLAQNPNSFAALRKLASSLASKKRSL